MSSSNDSIVNSVENMSQDDLVDLYEKLVKSYRHLKEENEKCKQELHHERLQKKTLISTQNDLQSELDSINYTHQKELQAFTEKSSSTTEHFRKTNQELLADKIQLETDVDELSKQLQDFKIECNELRAKILSHELSPRVSDSFSRNLEIENENLQSMLLELKLKLTETSALNSQNRSRIEELTEKILCLEDNLESKKIDLEEKDDAIETLQEKIHDMTIELALLKTAPDDANRKGNSLFAEVDDQRQKLKTLLQGERGHYLEMKKLFNAKEIEIRRLKRENMNIKSQIESCSSLLMRGEQIEIQTLSAQVSQLQSDNIKLESNLTSTTKMLVDLTQKTPGLEWVGSVVSTNNNEIIGYNDKIFKSLIEKTSLANNLNKIQKELAKTGLDCVKFKNLISRIVDKNNIELCQKDFLDIGFDEEVFESLKVEKFEDLEEQSEPSPNCSSFQLSESTIELIGGRERLGHVIPLYASAPENSNKDDDVKENKENTTIIVKDHKSDVNKSSPVKPPSSPSQLKVSLNFEKEKVVKFSNVLETKVIDTTQEQYEQSRQARKRPALTVHQIVIPSKTVAKSS